MRNTVSLKYFRLLLKLYPRDFRDTFGERMEEVFLASLAEQGSRLGAAGVLFSWLRVSWDTLVHAADLRFRPGRSAAVVGGGPTPQRQLGSMSGSWIGNVFSHAGQDLRFTARSLRKSPTFTVVLLTISGLGITLTALMFATVNASFFRPLPHVRAPEQLVRISRELPSRPGRPSRVSYQDYLSFREQAETLVDVVGVIPYREVMLRTGSDLDRKVIGGEVTANYFQALGIPMVLGRGILPEDAESGVEVAVLGHATWMRQFGGSSDALGQTVRIDGRRYTIVGVAPPGLGWLSGEPVESAVWIPLRRGFKEAYDWNALDVAGRRRDQATLPQVQAEFDAIAAGLVASDPDLWTEVAGPVGLRVKTDQQARLDLVGGPRGVASIIFYLVFIGLILVITCSNVATLLLNRALRRRAEIAMRLALGASRGRLVRHLLTESLVLFTLAGALSLLLLHWGTQLLAAGWGPFPAVADITLDARVISSVFGVTLLSGVLFGLVPALRASRPDIAPALRGTGGGGRLRRFGVRNLLVLTQVTASMVLVATSALIVRDLQQAEKIDVGFDPRGVAVASINLAHGDYSEEEGRVWLETLTHRLEGIPGVGAVALAGWVPLSGDRWNGWIRPEGYDLGTAETLYAVINIVTPRYFDMVGIPILAGRDFNDSDNREAPAAIIVNQSFARLYWPDQEPLGKKVTLGDGGAPAEVVGVVQDAMYSLADIRTGKAEPHFWVPRAQSYHSLVHVQVQTIGPQAPILAAMREEIRMLDEDLPIMELSSMESITENALFEEKASAFLFGGFSGLALFLAALGIYGVMAHAVLERTRELGVRLAVGAGPKRVVGLVLKESLRLSALGIGIGLLLAIPVGLGIRVLLVGVSPLDPWSLSGSVAVLLLAAVAAGLVPALRAARLDPVISLKSD